MVTSISPNKSDALQNTNVNVAPRKVKQAFLNSADDTSIIVSNHRFNNSVTLVADEAKEINNPFSDAKVKKIEDNRIFLEVNSGDSTYEVELYGIDPSTNLKKDQNLPRNTKLGNMGDYKQSTSDGKFLGIRVKNESGNNINPAELLNRL
ncbi:MAG: hypothetical protein HRT47_06310 [Candidatus Caenarcaniphilales bacterium]|nr:hypothetical protein [Candidatus Caenarcaniphilales bacterium]